MSNQTNIADELEADMAACRQLAGEERSYQGADPSVEELRAAVANVVAKENGVLSGLRALPTTRRVGLLALVVATGVVLVLVLAPAADLGLLHVADWLVWTGAMLALLGATVWHQLRPLHRPELPYRRLALVLVLGLTLPLLLSLAAANPVYEVGLQEALQQPRFVEGCARCSLFGLGVSAPLLLALLLVRRRPVRGLVAAGLLAAAGGLFANCALFVHCSIRSSVHVAIGHTLVGLGLGFVLLLFVGRKVSTSKSH